MRDIKFRYVYKDSKNNKLTGKCFTLEEVENGDPFDYICDSPFLKDYLVIAKDQYTGVKDTSGVEIYENDLLDEEWVVSFDQGRFVIISKFANTQAHITTWRLKVTGNTHEDEKERKP